MSDVLNMVAFFIGWFVLLASMIVGVAASMWFAFVVTAELFIKKFRDYDIFCDAVVIAHRKRGIEVYRGDK